MFPDFGISSTGMEVEWGRLYAFYNFRNKEWIFHLTGRDREVILRDETGKMIIEQRNDLEDHDNVVDFSKMSA